MDGPKHVWGVYVVQGAAITVRLRRAGEAGFEIESAYLEPNDGKTVPLHVASMLLARRGLRGEPAVVALPDVVGFLSTVRAPAGRPAAALLQDLYDATPFDAGHAELRHARVATEGGDEIHLVAAVKRSVVSAALHEFEHKLPHPAIAFGGAATVRGARALGLVPERCVLVEIEPHTTVAYVVDHQHVRRFMIPIGEREIVKDAAHCATLVDELRKAADERPGSAADAPSPGRPAPFVLVGPGAASQAVRRLLASKLGERLQGGGVTDARVRLAEDGRVHHAPPPALAGAVGAALEAFLPQHERLLFRELPADLHAHQEHPARPWVTAVVITLVALAAYQTWKWTRPAAAPAERPAPTAAEGDVGGGDVRDDAAAPVVPGAAARADRPRVETMGPGKARVSWPAGREGRVLRRFGVSWKDVSVLGAGAGSVEDEVTGGTQSYGWRIDDGETVFAKVVVPVHVELVGPAPNGGARFVLTRSWRGFEFRAAADVAPGEPIRTTSTCGDPPTDVVFDAGSRLVGVRTRPQSEPTTVRVPEFGADGRVNRAPDGSAVLVEKSVTRELDVLEAEGTTDEGPPRTWTRKSSRG